MFGHCLWWVIPKNHSWVRNVRTLFGKVSHPLHVTIATHVDERATDPRVPTLRMHRPIVKATSQDNFHALELPVHVDEDTTRHHLSILYSTKKPFDVLWTLQNEINQLDWSEPCIPYVECVDCSGHFSTWKVD